MNPVAGRVVSGKNATVGAARYIEIGYWLVEYDVNKLQPLIRNLSEVIRGQETGIRLLLTALISGGHVLLEDYPGTGKTTLAKALACSVNASFRRIQFTPDLLPTDILGVSVFDQSSQKFTFRPGPIFSQILLADEINRASPRTQSALLEAMAETQVSVEGISKKLDPLFFVVATQNPVEFHGTYPLPEAQMDRFAMRFSLGYVSVEEESSILAQHQLGHPLEELQPTISPADIMHLRQAASRLQVSDLVRRYIVELVHQTRKTEGVLLGAGMRASLSLMKSAQALALLEGMDFVTPEHIQRLAVPVIAHRLSINSQARFSGLSAESIMESVLQEVAPPL